VRDGAPGRRGPDALTSVSGPAAPSRGCLGLQGRRSAKVCNHPYMEWTRLSRRSYRYENPKGMDLDD